MSPLFIPPPLPATRSLAGPNPWLAVDKPGFETTVTWTPGMAMDAQTALAPPPSHHRVCKPEAVCYAKITEKLCLRNINAVGDLDSTLLCLRWC